MVVGQIQFQQWRWFFFLQVQLKRWCLVGLVVVVSNPASSSRPYFHLAFIHQPLYITLSIQSCWLFDRGTWSLLFRTFIATWYQSYRYPRSRSRKLIVSFEFFVKRVCKLFFDKTDLAGERCSCTHFFAPCTIANEWLQHLCSSTQP